MDGNNHLLLHFWKNPERASKSRFSSTSGQSEHVNSILANKASVLHYDPGAHSLLVCQIERGPTYLSWQRRELVSQFCQSPSQSGMISKITNDIIYHVGEKILVAHACNISI